MQHSLPLQIQFFGGFHVQLGEEPITAFNTDKVKALLIYMVEEQGHAFQRSHLAGLLWSDIPEEQALHNLRQALSLLRKAIQENDQDVIYATREKVGILKEANIRVDLHIFSENMGSAFRYYKQNHGSGKVNIVALFSALQLFENPFLDRFQLNVSPLFDEWLMLTREKYNNLAVEGLTYMVDYHTRRQENKQAIQLLRKIIKITPWDERSHYELMRLLALDHQWSVAQNQYANLVRYLKDDLNVEPEPKTTQLFQQIRTQSLSNNDDSTIKGGIYSNLTFQTNVFIGRLKEIDELSEMIANPTTRLVTLMGLGGVGKTRLAVEMAMIYMGIFKHGTFVIPLRNIETFDEFLSMAGNVLGVHFAEHFTKEQQIQDFCREKELLLIWDNLETLVDQLEVQNFLAELVNQCSCVMNIVTSRRKLNIHEEQVYQLEGISYRFITKKDKEQKQYSDAMHLFENRVKRIHRKFEIDEDNIASISKFCELVEGHPLAIELVAGSISSDVKSKIEETMEQGIKAFISALSNSKQYHQTLNYVFQISWQRLERKEQEVLESLSVFKGGFDKDTYRNLIISDDLGLIPLVNHSLLRQDRDSRFDMHEMVRQFAESQLMASERWDEVHDNHANYYLDFLMKQGNRFKIGDQTSSLVQIDLELRNIRSAWDWMLNKYEFDKLIPLLDILYQFFNIRSRFLDGVGWFKQAIDKIPDQDNWQLFHVMLLNRLGSLAYRARENDLAQESLSRCESILKSLQHPNETAFCLVSLGQIELRSNKKYQKALEYASQSIQLYQKVGDISGEVHAAYLKGIVLNRMSDYDAAEQALLHALRLARETNDVRQMVSPLNLLGDIACIKGQYEQAEKFFKEGLDLAIKLGDRFNQGVLLNNLATLFHYSKEYDMEKKVLLESLAICEEIGDQDGIALAYNNLSEVYLVKGDYEHAIRSAEKGLVIGQQIGEEWTIIVSLNNLGEAFLGSGELQLAKEKLDKAICMAYQIESIDLVARIAVNIGRVLFKEGKDREAHEWLLAAIQNSAIEYDHQKIAIQVLKDHQIEAVVEQNDDKLDKIVSVYCNHSRK